MTSLAPSKHLRLAEAGLFVVVLVLGALLTLFGGSVERPLFETGPEAARGPIMIQGDGESSPRTPMETAPPPKNG